MSHRAAIIFQRRLPLEHDVFALSFLFGKRRQTQRWRRRQRRRRNDCRFRGLRASNSIHRPCSEPVMRSWGNVGFKHEFGASVGRFEAVSVVVLKDVSGHC